MIVHIGALRYVLAVALDRHLVTQRSHRRPRQEQDRGDPDGRRKQDDRSGPNCHTLSLLASCRIDASGLFDNTPLP